MFAEVQRQIILTYNEPLAPLFGYFDIMEAVPPALDKC